MTKKYWDEVHVNKYSKADWARKPSIFVEQAIKYFPRTGKVLEIGTGQGNDAEYFALRGYKVIATDYAEEALKSAKNRIGNVQFLNVDTAEGLPFSDQCFDMVYSHMALHYFDAKTTRKVFEDIHRILKPKGVFATITNTMSDPEKEEFNYIELEPGYYQDPQGIKKRYFSADSLRELIAGLFEPLLLDAEGRTYKDADLDLIRFVGRKIA